jgi:hypothetical protein
LHILVKHEWRNMSDDKKVSNVLYMWKHCAICLAYLWVVAFLCLSRTYLIIMTERPPLWERGLVECQQRNPIMITRRTRRRRNKMHRFNHIDGGPMIRVWDQEVCSLCGLRFEPCGCSYDDHWRLTWSLTSGPVELVEVRASWPGHPH